ncbi:MAG: hypothetical protein IJX25_02170 [Clostridia bacterium]|nr:hypothetical protein [Clostridia bacterium]
MKNEKKYKKKCEVCNKTIDVDIYKQGECPFCGWWNCIINEENPDIIALPNLISLSKAKQLFSEGRPFEPNLDEFIEALHGYGEMQFEYKGIYYAVELIYDENKILRIRFYNSQTNESIFFDDDTDFKNNAKIGEEYIKDIWEETTDRYWLQ